MSENKTRNQVSDGIKQKNKIGNFFIGLVMLCLAFAVLWLNEIYIAKQFSIYNYIDKYAAIVLPEKESPFYDKLVVLSGPIEVEDVLSDDIITIPAALVLDRKVEMYQWKELKNSKSADKTATYSKVWSEKEINSDKFYDKSHKNPNFPIQSKRLYSKGGQIGIFNIGFLQLENIKTLAEYFDLPQNPDYIRHGNMYYKGNIKNPEVGDIRIIYRYLPANTVISLIGKQTRDMFVDKMSIKAGDIYYQYDGALTKYEMLSKIKRPNILVAWVLRLIGFVVMLAGLCLVIEPFSAMMGIIPPLEDFLTFITGWVRLVAAATLSMLPITVAWVMYWPKIGNILVVLLVGLFVSVIVAVRKNQRKLRVWVAGKND